MGYMHLFFAIIGEIFGTSLLKMSDGFTKLIPTISSMTSFLFSFYFLSMSLKSIQLNTAYAMWSGVGIVITTAVSVFLWKESINFASFAGIGLILVGVIVLNLYGPSH
ncbi:multidrug efflux SMR transporter [Metaclostridioides mangenotii]|uniref:DMT family transporter n=1 Tax=Metaclostridioides mangenotii TaxID=1540 RepID=UPI0028EBE4DC|nr:multidrug efflux SMR transporter [Clostridioides mangenotii]